MLKTKNFAIGMMVGISLASTLSASDQYYNQRQYGQGGQQDQRSGSQTRPQQTSQTKNYPVPQGYNGSQPFSYGMSNAQRQKQGQTGLQPSQNNQKGSMQRMPAPRTQCPTLTRPEFTSLLTKGSVVAANGMTLKKASSGNKGGLRKKLAGVFGMKQENTYPGEFIPQAQLDKGANQLGITLDSMAMSSGGLEDLNRGFCLYTHKPGGKPENLLAAILNAGSLARGHPSLNQQKQMPDTNDEVQEPSRTVRENSNSNRNPIPKNLMTGRSNQPPSNQMIPSQMNSGNPGEMDDRQAIKNLAGKTVGYYRPGDKPRFWKSLTKDEKSLVNDLKAKSDNGEPLNQEEQKVYKDVEKILNLPEGNVQSRPMPRQNRNPWGNSYGD